MDLLNTCVFVYLDDILIFSKFEQERDCAVRFVVNAGSIQMDPVEVVMDVPSR